MHRIAVIGSGYVGLVTGTCLAELGNRVVCIENDETKLATLKAGRVPFYEPGLSELMARNRERGRLSFAADVATGIRDAKIVFIAVGTPMSASGHADLTYVRGAAHEVALALDSDKLIVNKSTVPVETADLVAAIVREHNQSRYAVRVVSNPEFLREGSAVSDFMEPDRIVIGTSDPVAEALMRDLYAPLGATMIATDVRTAEMIKYTANAFLATKISFVNEIAALCEFVRADVKDVVRGVGSDRRIGPAFMSPGLGFGGSCLPKDVRALREIARGYALPTTFLEAVLEVNEQQIRRTVRRLEAALGTLNGKRIALLGLAFKPQTDDVRDSPALALARALVAEGVAIAAHDPIALDAAARVLRNLVSFVDDEYEAVRDVDAVVIATDWNEYKQLDLRIIAERMTGDAFFDMRNTCEPREIVAAGLRYFGVGRECATPFDLVSG
ncbi:MAG: UDP-glucose/GDP-mannose dehydrogenase family protein [Candidatus Baltobacteraceae bacterium]